MKRFQVPYDNPLPVGLVLLLPLLLLVVLGGVVAVRRVFPERDSSIPLGTALALGAWLVLTHLLGLVLQSFVLSVTIASCLLSVPGILALRRVARLSRDSLAKIRWGRLSILVLLTAFMWAPSAGFFHDEGSWMGHFSTVAQLQNGWYPPRFLPFPEHGFRYHYGFNVLAAALSGVLRLSIVSAVDLTTLLLWFLFLRLVWGLGESLVGARSGFFVTVSVAFAGGLPFVFSANSSLLLAFLSYGRIEGLSINPPLTSYFFQHPFGAGLVFAAATLMLLCATAAHRLAYHLALVVLLSALAQSHAVLFATVGAVVLVARLIYRPRSWLWLLASALAVAFFLYYGGGLFGGGSKATSGIVFCAGSHPDSLRFRQVALQQFGGVSGAGLARDVFLAQGAAGPFSRWLSVAWWASVCSATSTVGIASSWQRSPCSLWVLAPAR